MNEAKNSKICNLWTFSVILARNSANKYIFTKVFDQSFQKLFIFAVFALYIASILNAVSHKETSV